MKFLLLLFISIKCVSQTSPSSFLNNLCEIQTGNEKSRYLVIKISSPCDWEVFPSSINNEVIKLRHTEKGMIVFQNLIIDTLKPGTTDADAKLLLTTEGLKILTKNDGRYKYISSRQFKVNGVNAGEIVMGNTDDEAHSHFSIQTYFIYKRRIVMIMFTYMSNRALYDKMYQPYLSLFRGIVNKTKFK